MDPHDAVLKVEEELVMSCGAVGKRIISNAAKNAGLEKDKIVSLEEYQALLDSIEEHTIKFLGKTKSDISMQRWKKLI